MGNALNDITLAAFLDELEKDAAFVDILPKLRGLVTKLPGLPKTMGAAAARFAKGTGEFVGNPLTIGEGFAHPLRRMKAGWEAMTPTRGLQEALGGAAAKQGVELRTLSPQALKEFALKEKVVSPGVLGRGGHLLEPQQGLKGAWRSGGYKGLMEEMSRQGWTGQSRATKYIPWGQKALVPAFSAMEIPGIVNAPKPTQTGEGGALEKGLGALGSGAGWVFGSGMGFAPAMVGWGALNYAGGRLGRILDRMRAGAPMRKAISAPSPTEAAGQLADIQKYYG